MTLFLRSLLFNLCFFTWSMTAAVLFSPWFFNSPRDAQKSGKPWASGVLLLARLICGLKYEIRGREYIINAPVIYASKHQSAWETMIFLTLLKRPAYVLKRSLLLIPLWGWYLWRMQMIAIDRSGKASSLKGMLKQARAELVKKRPLIIYPEGTRKIPGDTPDYHPGVLALYSQLKVPVIPVALNSGFYWGKNSFTKRPGTIIMQFLPPIAPGMDRDAFMATLTQSIETASDKLLAEAKQNNLSSLRKQGS